MLGTVSRKSQLLRVAFAGFLAVAVVSSMGIGKAFAADEDEDTFEQGLIRQFMRGLGLKDSKQTGIAYQERAPLVVPPSRDLPLPETVAASTKDPAWPVDPDVSKRAAAKKRAAAEARKGSTTIEDSMRPLRPDELASRSADRRVPGNTPANTQTGAYPDPGRPLSPDELTAKGGSSGGLFGLGTLWNKIGPAKDEYATFNGEPSRNTLTAPPSGYRTPSSAQPYGVVVTTDPNAKANAMLKDRAVGEVGNPQ